MDFRRVESHCFFFVVVVSWGCSVSEDKGVFVSCRNKRFVLSEISFQESTMAVDKPSKVKLTLSLHSPRIDRNL